MPGYVLERLSSGTTGAPKRIPVSRKRAHTVLAIRRAKWGSDAIARPTIENFAELSAQTPSAMAGGLFGLLLALYQARPMVHFEKFVPEEWRSP